MRDYLHKLFKYNHWANTGLAQHIKNQSFPLPEVLERLSHVVAAEEIWYSRVAGLDFELLPLFEAQPWEILTPRLENSAQRWLGLVDQTENFKQVISYHTTSGTPLQTSLDDILCHVANHGTYHRGQIATLMRQGGQEPMVTDYVAFCRN